MYLMYVINSLVKSLNLLLCLNALDHIIFIYFASSINSSQLIEYHCDIKRLRPSLADLKNQPIVSSCVTHILLFCGYFKGQEEICFNPTSWHLVTYNFLRGHKFRSIIRSMTMPTFLA